MVRARVDRRFAAVVDCAAGGRSPTCFARSPGFRDRGAGGFRLCPKGEDMAQFPAGLRYSRAHEWVRSEEGSEIVRVGVTERAADALGDVVHVDLPTVGNEVVAGDACGGLESTTSARDVHSPVTGVVSAVNETVITSPETINSSPYGEGWLFEVERAEQSGIDDLLDTAGYAGLMEQ